MGRLEVDKVKMEIMSGQMLSGRYRLDAVLGRGGMATVWRGTDERLGRPVAVKVLDRSDTTEPNAVRRFDQEARTAGRLTHPHIVAVHDVGIDNGTPYLVMELVDGASLATLLDSGPLSVDQTVGIAAQVCDALAAAHAQGVVHRDIKPANILLTHSGLAKVCDFGIARLLNQQHARLTAPYTTIGTSSYMAPEQATDASVDARTDLYALGCVLYTMLTGTPPYTGDNPLAVMWQHQHQPIPSVRATRPDVPPDLDVLIGRLLAKNPIDRPATALEVRTQLARSRQIPAVPAARATTAAATPPTRTMPILEPTTTAPINVTRRNRSHPALVAAVAVAALALAGLIITWLVASHADKPAAVSTPTDIATSATAPPLAATSTPDTTDPLTAMRDIIDQQQQATHLEPQAAQELTGKLDEVGKALADGDSDKAADKLDDLNDKLDELNDDGEIAPAAYIAIERNLDQFSDALPTDEPKGKEKDEHRKKD
jgi:serine/threonine-protein kinase